jgi:serine/threonine protein kinase
VVQLLREEASGELYLVNEQAQSTRQRALLRLIAESSGPRAAQRVREFMQVAQALMALGEHPAIPRYYESFQEQGETFFLIEHIQGETLATRLAQADKPLREEEALLAASQVLDALVTLAQLTPPVVHRNVKPSNLLRRAADGRAYLVGFDIALMAASPITGEKPRIEPCGTRGYSPPEQSSRDRLPDPRWDLYALGATLHHLLTNHDPQKEKLYEYPPARRLNVTLSPEVERVLERAVARDANSRYHTAVEMKRDIDRLLGLTCPRCGAQLRRQARFCGRCGARLASRGAG